MDQQDLNCKTSELTYPPHLRLSRRNVVIAVVAAVVGVILGVIGFSWMSPPVISPFLGGI